MCWSARKPNTTQFVARIIAEKQYKFSLTLALIKETERACKNTKNGLFSAVLPPPPLENMTQNGKVKK
jgi:hypothetical protein